MASLCNPIQTPLVFPAKTTPTFDGTIVRTHSLILRSSLHFVTAKALPRSPRAIEPKNYVYPDPIPEFAAAETEKFKAELLKKLSKEKDTFGNDLRTVVNVCAEVLGEFLHKDYGGPGTLLIEPFTDMMVILKEKNLPGAPLAARSSLLWAQNYVDQDWENWNSKSQK
ncbi:hypothetical protein ACJIZ3_010271 [Penstemon smallii]|uniref:Uncharacterized protein n=1 Tax=Penstemon smallii TaxID=265156 RepID=A0ABD3TEV5_9LAMI